MRLSNWIIAAVLSTTALPIGAYAQQSESAQQELTLTGVVLDPNGAVVPGAAVTVYRGSTVVAQTSSDAAGTFQFQGSPHEYRVDVQAPGYAVLHSSPIPFTAVGPTRFTLMAGNFSSAAAPQSGAGVLNVSPVGREANAAPWEFGALFQGGLGLTEDRSNFRFLLAGVHLGKVLTGQMGSGLLRGNFEYAGELFPYWEAFTPTFQRISCTATPDPAAYPPVCTGPYTVGGNFHGVSVTPIILRWNFTHGERWMPWVQGAGGLIWTNHKFPAYGNTNPLDPNETGPNADTSVWNFTPQFGVGTHIFLKPRPSSSRPMRSLDFSANAVHISSASLGDRNPGVNASVQFSVGYTWWSR